MVEQVILHKHITDGIESVMYQVGDCFIPLSEQNRDYRRLKAKIDAGQMEVILGPVTTPESYAAVDPLVAKVAELERKIQILEAKGERVDV